MLLLLKELYFSLPMLLWLLSLLVLAARFEAGRFEGGEEEYDLPGEPEGSSI